MTRESSPSPSRSNRLRVRPGASTLRRRLAFLSLFSDPKTVEPRTDSRGGPIQPQEQGYDTQQQPLDPLRPLPERSPVVDQSAYDRSPLAWQQQQMIAAQAEAVGGGGERESLAGESQRPKQTPLPFQESRHPPPAVASKSGQQRPYSYVQMQTPIVGRGRQPSSGSVIVGTQAHQRTVDDVNQFDVVGGSFIPVIDGSGNVVNDPTAHKAPPGKGNDKLNAGRGREFDGDPLGTEERNFRREAPAHLFTEEERAKLALLEAKGADRDRGHG